MRPQVPLVADESHHDLGRDPLALSSTGGSSGANSGRLHDTATAVGAGLTARQLRLAYEARFLDIDPDPGNYHLDLDPDPSHLHKTPRHLSELPLPPHRAPPHPTAPRVSPLGLNDADGWASTSGSSHSAMAPLLVAGAAPAASFPKTEHPSLPPPPRLETVLSGSEHGFVSGAGRVADHPLQRLAVSSAAHQAAAALGILPPPGGRRLTRTASDTSSAYRLLLEGHGHGLGPVTLAAAAAAAAQPAGGVAVGTGRRAPFGRASFAGGALSTLSASGGLAAGGGARHLGAAAATAGGGRGGGHVSAGFGEEEDEREEERSLRDATLAYLRQLSDASNSFTTRHGAGGQQHHLHGGGGSGGCGSGGHSGGVSPSTTSIVPSACGTAPDSPVKPTYHRSILGGDSDTSHHQELERGSHVALAVAAHHHHLQVPHHYPSAGSIAARAAAATAIAAAGRGSLDTNRAAKAAAAMPHCGRVEVDSGVFGAAACARGQVGPWSERGGRGEGKGGTRRGGGGRAEGDSSGGTGPVSVCA